MSRIFPDSNYNIFEDLNNPRSKSDGGMDMKNQVTQNLLITKSL